MDGCEAGGCDIAAGDIVIGVGASEWQKPPRGWATLSNQWHADQKALSFEIGSDQELVVLEMILEGASGRNAEARCKVTVARHNAFW